MTTRAFSISPNSDQGPSDRAFTRLELVAVLTGIGLLVLMGLPLLAHTRPQVESAFCLNNLRHIGRAFHMWASEHGNENPWRVEYTQGGLRNPYDGFVLEGIGRFPSLMRGNAWFHFAFIHKELETPQWLVCPSDFDRKMARSFLRNDPQGGFCDLGYQNRALSYFVGLEPMVNQPRQLMSGDRHVRWTGMDSEGAEPIATYFITTNLPPEGFAWKTAIHGQTGNILFQDGSVESLTNARLDQAILEALSWRGHGHFLAP